MLVSCMAAAPTWCEPSGAPTPLGPQQHGSAAMEQLIEVPCHQSALLRGPVDEDTILGKAKRAVNPLLPPSPLPCRGDVAAGQWCSQQQSLALRPNSTPEKPTAQVRISGKPSRGAWCASSSAPAQYRALDVTASSSTRRRKPTLPRRGSSWLPYAGGGGGGGGGAQLNASVMLAG